MTQPVQEPSPRRTDSMLTWGQNQLYRRPGPPTGESSASFGRANCEVDTSAIDYVEPNFVSGNDATFERTDDGIFHINADERLVLEQGNPGLYAISINTFDILGNSGANTLTRILMNFVVPAPTGKWMLPGWFDLGGDNSAYEMIFPVYLDLNGDQFEFVPPPWTHLLYMNNSDEDLVFRLRVSIEEDTNFIASNVNVILSVTRITNATLDVDAGTPFS